jgi:hypothetical protein
LKILASKLFPGALSVHTGESQLLHKALAQSFELGKFILLKEWDDDLDPTGW